MNPRIQKVIDDIEKTKAKIAELQALLPELERKQKEMENIEIVKLFRSADIKPDEIAAVLKAIKNKNERPPEPIIKPAVRPLEIKQQIHEEDFTDEEE